MKNVMDNLDLPWYWNCLPMNPNFTIDMYEKFPTKPWDWNIISSSRAVNVEMIRKYHDKLDLWNVMYNKHFTLEMIEELPDMVWDWEFLGIQLTKDYECALEFLFQEERAEHLREHKVATEPLFDELVEMMYHPDNLGFMMENQLVAGF